MRSCTDCDHYRCLPDNFSRTAVGAVYTPKCEHYRKQIEDVGQAAECDSYVRPEFRREE